MRKPKMQDVEVDMVPLIDIISLLLMFLIIVGDTAASASSIQMPLPRNMDQALTDKEMAEKKINIQGRIVVQLVAQRDESTKETKYQACINNQYYDLMQGGGSKSLIEYLNKQIEQYGAFKRDAATGAVDAPVKLRIPEDAPMKDVEDCVMTLARVGLVNVQYAAKNKKD